MSAIGPAFGAPITSFQMVDPYTVVDGTWNLTGNHAVTGFVTAARAAYTAAIEDGTTPANVLSATGAAHSNVDDVNATGILFNLSATVNFVDVTADQTAMRILAPTYTSDDGVGDTIAKASTLYIDAAPAGAFNVTITAPYALEIGAGGALIGGDVACSNANGPAMLDQAASNVVPTLIPYRSAPTFGVGGSGTYVNVICGGAELLRIAGTSAQSFFAGGSLKFTKHANAPWLLGEESTAINPTVCQNAATVTAGLGGATEECDLICASTSILNVTATAALFSVPTTSTKNAIGDTQGIGLMSTNDTAASVGAQQTGPMVVSAGNCWETGTGSSDDVRVGFYASATQGAAADVSFAIGESVNGGAWVEIIEFNSEGINRVASDGDGAFWHEFHIDATKVTPGGSGATEVAQGASFYYLQNATTEYLYGGIDVEDDWDANTDIIVTVQVALNANVTANDLIGYSVQADYYGDHEDMDTPKTQTRSVDHDVVSDNSAGDVHKMVFVIDHDLGGNVIQEGDILKLRFWLDDTATEGYVAAVRFLYASVKYRRHTPAQNWTSTPIEG